MYLIIDQFFEDSDLFFCQAFEKIEKFFVCKDDVVFDIASVTKFVGKYHVLWKIRLCLWNKNVLRGKISIRSLHWNIKAYIQSLDSHFSEIWLYSAPFYWKSLTVLFSYTLLDNTSISLKQPWFSKPQISTITYQLIISYSAILCIIFDGWCRWVTASEKRPLCLVIHQHQDTPPH